jgi:hypothetical protein
MDGPTGDEAPHVMAVGNNVYFPWSPVPGYNPTYGTSLAAPTIASLAVGLISGNGTLSGYPELLKVIIMASASGHPVDGQWTTSGDNTSGAGLPNAQACQSMADNLYTVSNGDTITGVPYCGAFSWYFPSGATDGDTLVFHVATSSLSSSYTYFYITWLTNPNATTAGEEIEADDIDLKVTRDGASSGYSSSWCNTTEMVKMSHPSGGRFYRIRIKLYDRVNTGPLYGALAWINTH